MIKRLTSILVLLVLAVGTILVARYLSRVAREIEQVSTQDDTHKADAIVVLGAAEYRGKPSPVLEARLNHALWLWLQHDAPYIITTGGAGGDPLFTEGGVSRAYLSSRGVPAENILVENQGSSTVESIVAVAEIMQRMRFTSCIVVSDGYHIFRVKRMLQARGLKVYGSPRPSPPVEGWRGKWVYYRQAIGFALWRIGIPV
jgi:uncharacterized SAM-binding protein YcdF (DUF218 family)